MSDLAEEVRTSFERSRDEQAPGKGPVVLIKEDEPELAPGFDAAREYYGHQLLVYARRGYRHFAGADLPTGADELLALTTPIMEELLVAALVQSFADGVMIGQRSEYLVQMCVHFGMVEHLFHDNDFRAASLLMAKGFTDDTEVIGYFSEYIRGGLAHLSHVTGFSHSQTDPNKIWDVWIMTGSAAIAAAYLAGQRLGTSWREQDVLHGIEMATEVDRGSAGETEADS